MSIRYILLLLLQAVFDGLLGILFLVVVLLSPLSDYGIDVFSIPAVLLVFASRFLSLEIPIRAVVAARRKPFCKGGNGLIEYFIVGIVLWFVCQSIFWSWFFESLTIVPIMGEYPMSFHAAVIVGTIIFPLLFSRKLLNIT